MVNAQAWLDKNFPTPESQEQVQSLYISNNQGVNSKTNKVCRFYNTQLEEKLDLTKFINLSYLEIRGSSFNVDTYQKLTQLNLTACKRLKSFHLYYNDGQLGIEGGNLLNELHLQYCKNLVDLWLAEQLTNLSGLDIKYCPQLARIHNLDKLINLNTLYLYSCLNLTELNLSKLTKLSNINISNYKHYTYNYNSKMISLNLTHLNRLNNLILDGFSQLNSLVINDCPLLDNLSLSNCPRLNKVEGLEELKKLNTLIFEDCSNLPQPDFKTITPLKNLTIDNCAKFSCPPENFPDKLVSLKLSRQNFSTYDLEKLTNQRSLTDLSFSSCYNLQELNNLDKLTNLTVLYLYYLDKINSLRGFNDLTSLTKLTIENCASLKSVEGLEKLNKLGKFNYQNCPKLQIFTAFDQWKKERDEKTEEVKRQQEQVGKLEQKTDNTKKEFEAKIKKIEEKEKLTENEKKVLQKLKELFDAFDNQLDKSNIKQIEEILGKYKQLDFTNTPNLPAEFKLENENLSAYLDSSIQYYYEWQTAKDEAEKLRSSIQHERNKNQEEITKLEQKIAQLKVQEQEKQLAEIIDLQQQLKFAQDQAKELEHNLRTTIQTSEKSTQTSFDWDEELQQKDLKIEELKQQLTKQNRLSIKTKEINPSLGDASWANLAGESLSPSQIRAREKQKKQEQTAQIQTASPWSKPFKD